MKEVVTRHRRAGALGLTLLAVLLTVVGPAGCRPRDPGTSPGDDPSGAQSLGAAVATLRWTLAALPSDPATGDRYELRATNPGAKAVRLGAVTAYLDVNLDSPVLPESLSVPFPASVGAASAVSAVLTLPTEAIWPDEFTVRAWLRPAAASSEPVPATSAVFRPGGISFVPIWPEPGYLDFPERDDFLVIRFDPAVSLASLAANLRLQADPPLGGAPPGGVPVKVAASRNNEPLTYEVQPLADLTPFTRYRLVIGRELESADGKGRLGRDRAVVFATGGVSPDVKSRPAWSPDGATVAWTAAGPEGKIRLYVGEIATMTAVAKAGAGSSGAGSAGGSPPDVAAGTCAFSSDSRSVFFPAVVRGVVGVGRLDLATGQATVVVPPEKLGEPCGLGLAVSPDGGYLAIEANLGGVDAHSDQMLSVWLLRLSDGALVKLPGHGLTSALVGWSQEKLLTADTFESFDNSHRFRYNLYRHDPVAATASPSAPSPQTLLSAGELENVGGYAVSTTSASPVAAYWTWETVSLAHSIVHRPSAIWVVWGLEESSGPAPIRLTPGGRYRQVTMAPDGTLVAAAKAGDGSWDVAILDTADAIERVVATGPAAQFAPAWSSDGTKLAYFEVQGSSLRVVVLDPVTDVVSAFEVAP